jgi:hypothetical protein
MATASALRFFREKRLALRLRRGPHNLEAVRAARTEHEFGAAFDEQEGCGLANSAACAGDGDNFAFNSRHAIFLFEARCPMVSILIP